MNDNNEVTPPRAVPVVGSDGFVRLTHEQPCYCSCWWAGAEHEHPLAFDQGREQPTREGLERIARALWDEEWAGWLVQAAANAERRHGPAWAAEVVGDTTMRYPAQFGGAA